MTSLLFLSAAFFTDILLGMFFGGSFIGLGVSATPNVLLIVLILITLKQDVRKSLILGFFVGLIFDLFNVDTVFTYAFIYLFTLLTVNLWSTRINETFIELFLLTLSAVFVKEFLAYFLNISINGYVLSIGSWAANHLTYTILISLFPIIFSVFIKLRLIEKRVRAQRSNKKSDFFNYRY